jgi:hypothetical protein
MAKPLMGKYIKKIKMPRKYSCQNCNIEFIAKKRTIKFCSLVCFQEFRKKSQVEMICSYCKIKFLVRPCQIRKGEGRFCSDKCRRLAFVGKGHPAWKGGIKRKRKLDALRTKEKMMNDPRFRISRTMSRQVSNGLKSGKEGKSWKEIVPYSLNDLMLHLEKKFQKGMTWRNYGVWHIDHIIPISVFNFQTYRDIDFQNCWALENLQPLWAKDNMSKNNKLYKVFQPSLAISI